MQNSHWQPFQTALQRVTDYAIATFKQQIDSQQLYYHGLDHVEGVARRARLIFDTAVPFYLQEEERLENHHSPVKTDWNRHRDLLQLGAIAHDMLQIFVPQTSAHTSRRRQSGHSERATLENLLGFMQQIDTAGQPIFTPADSALLREAIEATICQFDAADGSIYQPLLYAECRGDRPLSLVARALALADLGTLGMEGIEAYRQEGRLLLLEENLDVLSFLKDDSAFDSELRENLRQRLLKRSRFDVSFARGRVARLDMELEGLPAGAIIALKGQLFRHLTPATVETIAATTPTDSETSLTELLDYFQLRTQL